MRFNTALLHSGKMGDEATGARRRYYSITPQGRARYQANVEEWRIARELIDSLIMEGESHHD